MEILKHPEKLVNTFQKLRAGAKGILLCDYDGTLAPFREDPLQATPYPWVPDLLTDMRGMGVRVVLVTGRRAADLHGLLPLSGLEIWGSHGREHIAEDGRYTAWQSEPAAEALLDHWHQQLRELMPHVRMERKVGCLAVHFRGLPSADKVLLEGEMEKLRQRLDVAGILKIKAFHLGCELVAPGPNKGDVVREILAQERATEVAPVYLGDDVTDEDAFAALGDQGLRVLVSVNPRPTHADIRLESPAEVLEFFRNFREAARRGGQ